MEMARERMTYTEWLEYNKKLAATGDELAQDRIRTASLLELYEMIRTTRQRQSG